MAIGTAVAHAGPGALGISAIRRLRPTLSGTGRLDHVALTFDDGPSPRGTPAVLEVLEEFDLRATFFVVGRQLRAQPALADQIVAAGHEVAVHCDIHRSLLLRTPWETYDDLRRARDTIADLTGTAPRWWRPTYGVPSGAALLIAAKLGLTPVLWRAWGREWKDADVDQITTRVLRAARGGSTVLLHDGTATPSGNVTSDAGLRSAAALRAIVPATQARGLSLGPLHEHGLHTPRAEGAGAATSDSGRRIFRSVGAAGVRPEVH